MANYSTEQRSAIDLQSNQLIKDRKYSRAESLCEKMIVLDLDNPYEHLLNLVVLQEEYINVFVCIVNVTNYKDMCSNNHYLLKQCVIFNKNMMFDHLISTVYNAPIFDDYC